MNSLGYFSELEAKNFRHWIYRSLFGMADSERPIRWPPIIGPLSSRAPKILIPVENRVCPQTNCTRICSSHWRTNSWNFSINETRVIPMSKEPRRAQSFMSEIPLGLCGLCLTEFTSGFHRPGFPRTNVSDRVSLRLLLLYRITSIFFASSWSGKT